MRMLLGRWLRVVLGVVLGSLAAPVELAFVVMGGLWLLATLVQRAGAESPVFRGARWLAEAGRRRAATWYGAELDVPRADRSAFAYLSLRWVLGAFSGAVLLVALVGAGYASFLVWGWFVLSDISHPGDVLLSALGGLFLLFLAVQGVYGIGLLDAQLAKRFLGPSDRELLKVRIGELSASRAGVVEAVHDERRRIERDLHDGVQQRLVALGMLLGRSRRTSDPEKAGKLLIQAHEETQRALTELREVAWRVFPAALDEGGLAEALETVAERAGIPVHLTCELPREPTTVIQTVAYFVVAEAVTNAAKHSGATLVTVRVMRQGSMVVVRIEDNGSGGADPTGGGLLGLARRVAALDGRFTVDSPAAGPTIIIAELPCG
ncbi:sensor histidine kinase [Streptomyces violaceusniger]|uniref:histidine kinase n=1 Tax=Streptomyces violaceusniger (strain Tu 4113) TaxID=653045 RepID=G2PGX5_STRV4|nr:histidine kinase [Streptomyces violaceusniger]AEM88689.1 putative signal transduction histidine kinase [Streptomyces violaceusniger Tu 4113]